jgi:hypothetical protein
VSFWPDNLNILRSQLPLDFSPRHNARAQIVSVLFGVANLLRQFAGAERQRTRFCRAASTDTESTATTQRKVSQISLLTKSCPLGYWLGVWTNCLATGLKNGVEHGFKNRRLVILTFRFRATANMSTESARRTNWPLRNLKGE